MGKRILILTCSPRPKSDTNKMAQAFEEAAVAKGHEVVYFDAGKKNLQGCHGCNACWSKGKACVRDDDFNELAEYLETCDVLLIVTPLYWFSFPAQVKGAIDKLYAYGGAGGLRPLGFKQVGLFVAGELLEEWEYEPIIKTFNYTFEFLEGIENMGVLQVGALHEEKYMQDALEKSRQFVERI